tara:strand:+ start:998 stop:1579 length:582 start_codon:yes stop_codon:yes gene_type:complete
MNYSFEYIDIILLAMIAGFIFLRLRGILGRRTDNKESFNNQFDFVDKEKKSKFKTEQFDDAAKEKFIVGAKAAYEMIITAFAKGDVKQLKILLNKNVYNEFLKAIEDRKLKKLKSETTFIGIKSVKIKDFTDVNSIYNVTVDFISEIITCTKNIDNKVVAGDPDKIKIVTDTWKFSKDKRSNNPNWLLIETQS